jgi:ParB family chromosome partitioning protein
LRDLLLDLAHVALWVGAARGIDGLLHLRLQLEVQLPITVAIEIANGNDDGIQRALSDGYASGEFRGSRLKAIRKLIEQRAGREDKEKPLQAQKPLTGSALVKLYKQRVQEQQKLVAKADQAKERLLVIASAMRDLFSDEDFRTVLQAEKLIDMPEQLKLRIS